MPENQSLFIKLTRTSPWWVSVSIGLLLFYLFGFVFPGLTTPDPYMQDFYHSAPKFAPLLGLLFVSFGISSAFYRWKERGQEKAKGQQVESLKSLDWNQLEATLMEVYRRKGFEVEQGDSDATMDLILKRGESQHFVLFRHWKKREIGAKVIREFDQVMREGGAETGTVITLENFTPEAEAAAKETNIKLMDESALLQLIGAVQQKP